MLYKDIFEGQSLIFVRIPTVLLASLLAELANKHTIET